MIRYFEGAFFAEILVKLHRNEFSVPYKNQTQIIGSFFMHSTLRNGADLAYFLCFEFYVRYRH